VRSRVSVCVLAEIFNMCPLRSRGGDASAAAKDGDRRFRLDFGLGASP